MDEINVSAEVGAMPVEATEYAFKHAFKGIQRCFTKNLTKQEFIGGEIALKVLVGPEGQVKHVFAEHSTIGHDDTETCMFQALRNEDWPKPVGGLVGVAQNAFVFETGDEVRPPVPWTEDAVRETIHANSSALSACKGSATGVVATLYVDPNGRALSVGVSGTDERVEDARACLVRVLGAASYPSPGSWPAKVSVQL